MESFTMTFDYSYVSNICSSNERLPLAIRTDKNIAKNFIDFIKENLIVVKNEFIPILSNWCNEKNDSTFSKISSIEYMGKNQTFDMEVEDAHSYKANGIFAHNTVNMPETVTEEEIEQVLLAAWRGGCKGVTVYRDKCRSGVLIATPEENKINIFKENNAPRRPRVLPAEIMRFTNKGEKWIGILGLLDNRPYEIFTGPADQVVIPTNVTHVEIIKERIDDNNVYNLKYVDKDGFSQEYKGLSRAFNREYWNTGRLVSAILRHGMPLPNVLQLLDKLEIDNHDSITTWKAGVKRMIKKYIHDGTKVTGETCKECNSNQLIFKEGCISCANCGWSKCG